MPALFRVDPRSGVPIYVQLVEQVKRAVALGALAGGEQLPTVKALALSLTVNPNTVARAYRDLEREGVIDTSPGRGSFVRGNGVAGETRHVIAGVVTARIDEAVREAHSLGVSNIDLRSIVDHSIDRAYGEEDA